MPRNWRYFFKIYLSGAEPYIKPWTNRLFVVVSISYNLIDILELLLRGVSLKHFKIVIPVAYQDLFKKMISFINKEERIPRLQVSIIMIVCLHTWRLPQSQQSVTFSVLEFTWVWGVFYLYQFLRFYHADYNHIENTLAQFQIVDNLWPAMKCQWQFLASSSVRGGSL